MTPKLYDDVNNKLASIWGTYAGWAHSVRILWNVHMIPLITRFVGSFHLRSEVFLELRAPITFTFGVTRQAVKRYFNKFQES